MKLSYVFGFTSILRGRFKFSGPLCNTYQFQTDTLQVHFDFSRTLNSWKGGCVFLKHMEVVPQATAADEGRGGLHGVLALLSQDDEEEEEATFLEN